MEGKIKSKVKPELKVYHVFYMDEEGGGNKIVFWIVRWGVSEPVFEIRGLWVPDESNKDRILYTKDGVGYAVGKLKPLRSDLLEWLKNNFEEVESRLDEAIAEALK